MKNYESPEFDLVQLSFESILDKTIDTSSDESGNEGYNDNNEGDL